MSTEVPQEEEQEILPEIVLDETADAFVPDDDPPVPQPPDLPHVVQVAEVEEPLSWPWAGRHLQGPSPACRCAL